MKPRNKDSKENKKLEASSAPPLKESASIEEEEKKPFSIVGMGGSAGSLEAFDEFFRNMSVVLDWPSC